MENLVGAPIFQGISEKDIKTILQCLSPIEKKYIKEEILFTPGSILPGIGLVLDGNLLLLKEDYWGNRRILARVSDGDLLGESFVCPSPLPIGITIQADSSGRLLFLNVQKLLTACPSVCPFHSRVIKNLLSILAEKNRLLNKKLDCTAPRKIRDRLAAYFSQQVQESGSTQFQIPFTRQQLADYLYVDRSAMTTELYKMQEDGLITFQKNTFSIKT